MKWAFVYNYYPEFLAIQQPHYPNSYKLAKKAIFKNFFGVSNVHSHWLKQYGDQTEEIIANDLSLQRMWLTENSHNYFLKIQAGLYDFNPYIFRSLTAPLREQILVSQIQKIKPEVLYVFSLGALSPQLISQIRPYIKLLVGQIAAPFSDESIFRHYDLVISSLPNLVSKYTKQGIQTTYSPLAFDDRVLTQLKHQTKKYPVTFIGGFASVHQPATALIEKVAQTTPVDIWGYGVDSLKFDSPLRHHYHGQAWGLEMYRIFAKSNIVINRHSTIAGKYANNMRLYEVTGVGSFLITEARSNLAQLFTPGKEVETYSSAEELSSKIKYYLKHPDKREKIAKAGQKKTLTQHTYKTRVHQLKQIITKYLPKNP